MRVMRGASIRQHDLQHAAAKDAKLTPKGIFARCWSTKTTGVREGRVWACSREHFQCEGWLEEYWELYQQLVGQERDYWLPLLDLDQDTNGHTPENYASLLSAIRWLLSSSGIPNAQDYGCHSAKPMLITHALGQGVAPHNYCQSSRRLERRKSGGCIQSF